MKNLPMSSMERMLTTISHKEPDRVPIFLLLTMQGARELGMSIKEYFSKAENIVSGQLKLRAKYQNDCLLSFFYAAIEVEAFGADVIYIEDGPPNAGAPIIRNAEDINNLRVPDIENTACLQKVLQATELLKESAGDDVPIVGVSVSPFSLPVMQMGFEKYIELIHESPKLHEKLMDVNTEFCVAWSNAQLAAGATTICYFDPVSSPTITPKSMYAEKGARIARNSISRIKGPTVTHLASGRGKPILKQLIETGTHGFGASMLEDLAEIKAECKGKIAVIGNLNGIEMRRWTPEEAEEMVKATIAKAAPGGGFILSDCHGEIPWQVSEETLHAISAAVKKWGNYPLSWIADYAS
jgi:uroporphyrinogen decarboxylase